MTKSSSEAGRVRPERIWIGHTQDVDDAMQMESYREWHKPENLEWFRGRVQSVVEYIRADLCAPLPAAGGADWPQITPQYCAVAMSGLKDENDLDMVRETARQALVHLDTAMKALRAAPPLPPLTAGTGLKRYGVARNGAENPICQEMPDGYWTPWHVASAEVARLSDRLTARPMLPEELREDAETVMAGLYTKEPCKPGEFREMVERYQSAARRLAVHLEEAHAREGKLAAVISLYQKYTRYLEAFSQVMDEQDLEDMRNHREQIRAARAALAPTTTEKGEKDAEG